MERVPLFTSITDESGRSFFEIDSDAGIARLVEAWQGAPVENLEVLALILETAQQQVLAYYPRDEYDGSGGLFPRRLVFAQLQQAINLWNASTVSSAGEVGPEGYSFTPRPLDKTIRAIIRPIRGTVDVF